MTRKKSPSSSTELFDSSLTVTCRDSTLFVAPGVELVLALA
jgi:hypothetical protein